MSINYDEIRKALEEATPGPWSWEGKESKAGVRYQHVLAVGGDNPRMGDGICNTYYSDPLPLEWGGEIDILPAKVGRTANARLIAKAPTWIRELLEENERLQKQLNDLA